MTSGLRAWSSGPPRKKLLVDSAASAMPYDPQLDDSMAILPSRQLVMAVPYCCSTRFTLMPACAIWAAAASRMLRGGAEITRSSVMPLG
ncbi:hypothetical protein D3C78_1720660 [compost metagenome]